MCRICHCSTLRTVEAHRVGFALHTHAVCVLPLRCVALVHVRVRVCGQGNQIAAASEATEAAAASPSPTPSVICAAALLRRRVDCD